MKGFLHKIALWLDKKVWVVRLRHSKGGARWERACALTNWLVLKTTDWNELPF